MVADLDNLELAIISPAPSLAVFLWNNFECAKSQDAPFWAEF
jgi:hypothetical protein